MPHGAMPSPITDFVQREPTEGAPPTDRMEVRFVYDDDALYVGARMFSDAPIQAPMGRRDNGDQAEHLLVSLDTYLDRRTASTFGTTATGVRLDHLLRDATGRGTRTTASTRYGRRGRASMRRGGLRSSGSRFRNCASPTAARRSGD